MYRPNNPRFNVPPAAKGGQHFSPGPTRRTPGDFWKDLLHIQTNEASKPNQLQISKLPPALKNSGAPGVYKWKSSFTAIDKDDYDKNSSSDNGSRERSQIYDPYEPVRSDSDEQPSPAAQIDTQESRGRWDTEASIERRRLNPGRPLFPIPDTESTDRAGYSSGGRTVDYRPEAATVRLSSPSQHNYKQTSGYTGLDQLPPPRPEVKDPGKNEAILDKNLISCDLCEVELSNGQELEEHLDCKTHWDTLEYVQKHNSYDDMTIAFLQEVMLDKSRKCSREKDTDTALQALQKYDHMTKVEMFHCAACNVFVLTSALAVQNHITTQEHISNTKEFEVRQRRSCLDKASTMMKELKPQFKSFVKLVALELYPDLDGPPPPTCPPAPPPYSLETKTAPSSEQLQELNERKEISQNSYLDSAPIAHRMQHQSQEAAFNMPMVNVSGPKCSALLSRGPLLRFQQPLNACPTIQNYQPHVDR